MFPRNRGARTCALSCPSCGHTQHESSFAVSTYCRSCGSYFKIRNGLAVPNTPVSLHPLHGLQPAVEKPPAKVYAGSLTERLDEARRSSCSGAPTVTAPEEQDSVRREVFQQMISGTPRTVRDIECLECGHVNQIPADSGSALCPRCGEFVSLKNYEIHDFWDRRIRTRGDVFLHRKARVEDIPVQCHNLTVEGRFSGSVDCTGDFIIRRHGKIMGRVRCRRLVIESRAKVEFANNVHAEEVYIDGTVSGHIHCAGKLVLERNASLKGDLKVSSLVVNEGARHSGLVSVHGTPRPGRR